MNKIEHIDECKRIQSTLLGQWNIEATLSECQGLWRLHYCLKRCGTYEWIQIPNDQIELTDKLQRAIESLNWAWEGPYSMFEGNI